MIKLENNFDLTSFRFLLLLFVGWGGGSSQQDVQIFEVEVDDSLLWDEEGRTGGEEELKVQFYGYGYGRGGGGGGVWYKHVALLWLLLLLWLEVLFEIFVNYLELTIVRANRPNCILIGRQRNYIELIVSSVRFFKITDFE